MKIVVLVKQVPDTWGERHLDPTTGRADRAGGEQVVDEIGERAVELALSHKDRDRAVEVVVVTMGPAKAADALRKVLAMGADRAVHVQDDRLAGADLVLTATVLAATVRTEGFDLLVVGNESTDGRGGVLAAMLAEHLRVPLLSAMTSATVEGSTVVGTRAAEGVTARVRADLPAVVSVTEAVPEARFAGLRGIMAAKRKPVTRRTLADLEVELPAAASAVRSVSARPPRTGGTQVVDDGTAVRRLVDLLAERHLI
jgi:electron transfer flavoprotein beta subunit